MTASVEQILTVLEVVVNAERFVIPNTIIRLGGLYPKIRLNLIRNYKKVQLLLCLVLCEVIKCEIALIMSDYSAGSA